MRPPLLLQPQHAPRQYELCQVATSVGQPIDFAKVAADVVGVLPVIAAAVAPLLLDCRPRDRFGVEVVGVGEAAELAARIEELVAGGMEIDDATAQAEEE